MGTAVLEAGPRNDLTTAEQAIDAFCRGFDPALVTATEAADTMARVTVMQRQLAAVNGRSARRVEGSSAWKHAGFRSMPEWMAAKTGEPVGVSAGVLDTARQLETVPATADALAAGEVSVAAAREIAGAVAVHPTAEATLLAVAKKGHHRELQETAARVRQAARSAEDEAVRHRRLRARRFARTRTDVDGLVVVHAGFAPADWAPFAAALTKATDVEFARARKAGRREPVEAYAADALLGLLGGGARSTDAAGAASTSNPTTTATTATATAATTATAEPGLPGIAEPEPAETPGPAESAPNPSASTTKYQVLVLVDGIALKRGHVATGERCEIAGVGPVSVDWVRRLLPDALVDALVHDGVDITTHAPIRKRRWSCRPAPARVAPGR